MLGAQKLRDLSVDRAEALIAIGFEQLRGKRRKQFR